ncbi:hypothetical protein IV203_003093 [Nitzschia inconspicua]|uniref:Uncharacterized protein n=1 Tax=Nitzschia inconspicua TaxID=303405 RepID=A0A9K3L185_9STRA|nr:hypothetical protein IV203_003093 [Nitzschia inconspicua]
MNRKYSAGASYRKKDSRQVLSTDLSRSNPDRTKPIQYKTKLLFVGGLLVLVLLQFSWKFFLLESPVPPGYHEAAAVLDGNATATTRTTTIGSCSGYDGVLHIASGDQEGAAGTIFFLFVVNQLIYADMYNLLPWVHLNNVSKYVYDDKVHGTGQTAEFEILCGKTASWASFTDPITNNQHQFPGMPQGTNLSSCRIYVEGNGVWNSYFEPVFSPTDPSCASLPLIRMTYSQIIPSLHVFAPWSVRSWRYGGLPPSLRQLDKSYQEWFAPMRRRAHSIVKKYFRFLPYLHERAVEYNPHSQCLALHIRHSDKANRRKRIPVPRFLPYVEAYYNHQMQQRRDHPKNDILRSFSIYLATDSSTVIDMIQETWPKEIQSVLQWQKGNVLRSSNTTAVFQLVGGNRHHDGNVQVLTDILAMSRCQYIVHGLSAVSEAVHYLNPLLHNQSVNLDDRKKDIVSVEQFRIIMDRVTNQ